MALPPELVRLHLERILSSAPFAASPRLQQFLTFVVEETLAGRAGEIKETVVAQHVFNRGTSFDPRTDSVVRVEARNLRNRLRDYYLANADGDSLVIELPRGSYVPAFRPKEPPAAGPPAPVRRLRRLGTLGAAFFVILLVVSGYFGAKRIWFPGPPLTAVAVLPFDNLDGANEGDYLCDGLAEDLTASLARAPSLKVAARGSAFRFRKNQDLREFGQQLGVGSVIQGSIRRTGDRWRVTLHLIHVGDGYHLWADTFEGPAGDLSAFRERSAAGIARVLTSREGVLAATYLPGSAAQDLYWRARYVYRKGGDGQAESMRLLEQAVRLEPRFAQAWGTLSNILAHMVFHGQEPRTPLLTKAREAARQALALDSGNADAYIAQAMLDYSYDWNWPSSERNFRRALESAPSLSRGHQAYALALLTRGRFDAALSELKQAKALDPLSHVVSNDSSTVLYCARRYKEAIRSATSTIEADPEFVQAYVIRASSYAARGDFAAADREFQQVVKRMGRQTWFIGRMGYAYARWGRKPEAARWLAESEAPRVQQALIHTALGDRARALDLLEQAAQDRETDVVFMAVEPLFADLASEPRFLALKQRLGL